MFSSEKVAGEEEWKENTTPSYVTQTQQHLDLPTLSFHIYILFLYTQEPTEKQPLLAKLQGLCSYSKRLSANQLNLYKVHSCKAVKVYWQNQPYNLYEQLYCPTKYAWQIVYI